MIEPNWIDQNARQAYEALQKRMAEEGERAAALLVNAPDRAAGERVTAAYWQAMLPLVNAAADLYCVSVASYGLAKK